MPGPPGHRQQAADHGPPNDFASSAWARADGVPHRIADELTSEGVSLGGGVLGGALAARVPLGFVGFGAKDEVRVLLGWHARLP